MLDIAMRVLILNADYPEFLYWLYAQHPGLESKPYEEQMRVRVESLFGVADFYSSNLRKLGHEAWDIHVNNEFMQKAWAREHGIRVEEPTPLEHWARAILSRARQMVDKTPLLSLRPLFRPMSRVLVGFQSWFYDIIAAQIKYYKPDILLNQAMDSISIKFLKEMKPYVRLLVGQIAAPFPEGEDYSCYDLIISSLKNFVEYFRKQGIPSELHRFGFEPRVLSVLDKTRHASISVSFVGGLSRAHGERIRLLEYLCQRYDVQIWGRGIESLPRNSPIYRCYKGQAWGKDMYKILYNSKITLNFHGRWAGSYANNMRLYEATGVGTLLITDWKENLHELFEPGKEVIAYRTPEECGELIQYYLEHEVEREAIARAGQERTLREHTYYQRMQELVDIITPLLHRRGGRQ
jgi:hypothetical protein